MTRPSPDAPALNGGSRSRSAADWRRAVQQQERRGELLLAFDLAERGLEEHPGDIALQHRAVLALARAGATEEAARRLSRYGLDRVQAADVQALRARITKDEALALTGARRRRRASDAAELYQSIFARTGSYYPAINAATMSLVAGDVDRARRLTRATLAALEQHPENTFWAHATGAEAHLLLGDVMAATGALAAAAAVDDGDYAAMASTRRQLRLICELEDLDPALLDALAGPPVVHFCGHRAGAPGDAGRIPRRNEAVVASRIADVIARVSPGYGYGSLASGADIMWAEALLASGCELHVVLPFATEEFVRWSVAPAGEGWVSRFRRLMTHATAVRYATDDAYLGDDVLFRYGSELAMGLAVLRARYLDAEVRQLAVWDRRPAGGAAGTTVDLTTWRRSGRRTTFVSPDPEEVPGVAAPEPPAVQIADADPSLPADDPLGEGGRVVGTMLFGDIKGFSVLSDEQLSAFSATVLGAFATVLDRHDRHVWHRKTWGDAVFVVLDDARAAAICALDLQDAMAAFDLGAAGLPAHLALRLAGHVGPVFRRHDPVVDEIDFVGSHVSRTARIEPVTPVGAVYVTEAFAAALALRQDPRLACDYVGHMPAAKDYGRLRMYRLRRTEDGSPARDGDGGS